MPPIKARMLMCPNAFDQRLLSTGSRTIKRVAAMLRIISGRKRMASVALKPMLTGTGDLRVGWGYASGNRSLTVAAPIRGRVSKRLCGQFYAERYVDLSLL